MNYLTRIKDAGGSQLGDEAPAPHFNKIYWFHSGPVGLSCKKRLISCILFTPAYLHELSAACELRTSLICVMGFQNYSCLLRALIGFPVVQT